MEPPLRDIDRNEFWAILLRYWGSIALVALVGGIGVRNGGGQAWGAVAAVIAALIALFFSRSETAKRLRPGYWRYAFVMVIGPIILGLAIFLATSYIPRFI